MTRLRVTSNGTPHVITIELDDDETISIVLTPHHEHSEHFRVAEIFTTSPAKVLCYPGGGPAVKAQGITLTSIGLRANNVGQQSEEKPCQPK